MEPKIVDHLFRHQYGKMIAILTKVFGLTHLELIEDAVQDTFIKATLKWRKGLPDNPEAWLMRAARNRAIDLLRKIKPQAQVDSIPTGTASIGIQEIFLDHEIEDSQLRMIFVACHPELKTEEQIAFALRAVSGFSMREIAAALLTKEETVKKRLIRARKKINDRDIQFDYPDPQQINERMQGVQHVIYLIFNEGFHSTKRQSLVDKELCGEALRLSQLLIKKVNLRSESLYALFALMCFQSARLDSKINEFHEIIDLEHQDRTKWYRPLINLGNSAMLKCEEYEGVSSYYIEASIVAEHLRAPTFEDTDWAGIHELYRELQSINPSPMNLLNMAIVALQYMEVSHSLDLLESISPEKLEHRKYLLYGAYAEVYQKMGDTQMANKYLDHAIQYTTNTSERNYLKKKKIT